MTQVGILSKKRIASRVLLQLFAALAKGVAPVLIVTLTVAAVIVQISTLINPVYLAGILGVSVLIVAWILSHRRSIYGWDTSVKGLTTYTSEEISQRLKQALPGSELQEREVIRYLQTIGVTDVEQNPVMQGGYGRHEVDLIFYLGGKKYVGEIKARLLVLSDIENAKIVLEDLRTEYSDISGWFLFTSTTPTKKVLQTAKALQLDIRVLPLLSVA